MSCRAIVFGVLRIEHCVSSDDLVHQVRVLGVLDVVEDAVVHLGHAVVVVPKVDVVAVRGVKPRSRFGVLRVGHHGGVGCLVLGVRVLGVLRVVEGLGPHDTLMSGPGVLGPHPVPIYPHTLGTQVELNVAVHQPLLSEDDGEVGWDDERGDVRRFPVQV